MKKIYNLHKIRNVVATIGIFDGVHRGHQKILKRLVKEAARQNTKSLVVTFYPHPREVLNHGSKVPLLISLNHRLKLIKDMGADFLQVLKFTKSFSAMKADDFIKKILIDRLGVKALVVGENFLFGYRGEGDFSLLQRISKKYNLRLYDVKPVKMKGACVSSTRIRRVIEKGDLKEAMLMLGRPVTILGTVVEGRGIGRKLGFPTANIDPHHEAIPPSGVYAVDVKIEKRPCKAILNIGTRPTFGRPLEIGTAAISRGKDIEPTIELYILDFKKDIYGKDVEIIFKRKVRNEKRFSSAEALRRQIQKDILKAS